MILKRVIDYPDSDGKPMAESTLQAFWILDFYGNLMALFRHRADVFVAADNLWYPVEGEDKLCQGPDVYVVFGRPKKHRGSYRQWEEEGVPLTVVFEIVPRSDAVLEMAEKLAFYDEHGVEEYYVLRSGAEPTARLCPWAGGAAILPGDGELDQQAPGHPLRAVERWDEGVLPEWRTVPQL
ncbi:MAG: Uma2 family endonuclease [Gemmataceae bacterium]|nr:Uma2 family endonuclease [Gemmataceae bacterium]